MLSPTFTTRLLCGTNSSCCDSSCTRSNAEWDSAQLTYLADGCFHIGMQANWNCSPGTGQNIYSQLVQPLVG